MIFSRKNLYFSYLLSSSFLLPKIMILTSLSKYRRLFSSEPPFRRGLSFELLPYMGLYFFALIILLMLQSISKKPILANTCNITAQPTYDDFEEFDNPLSSNQNSRFLETKFRLSINDLKNPPNLQRNFRASFNLIQQKNKRQSTKQNQQEIDVKMVIGSSRKKIGNDLAQNFRKNKEKNSIHKFNTSVWDEYKMVSKIGEGSFGKVYRGQSMKCSEFKAIKVVKKIPHRQNLQAEILSQCDHPNIVKIYQIFDSQKELQMVLEECRGGSLQKCLKKLSEEDRKTIFTEQKVKAMAKQILNGLDYLHSQLIVHCDIKLENIAFLNEQCNQSDIMENTIKLIDFGLAKKTKFKVMKLQSIGGTKVYQSPEALNGWISEKSDIWGLGIVLHVLLCGKFPFSKKRRNTTIASNKYSEPPMCEGPEWDRVSDEAKLLINKMLENNFRKRPNAKQCLQFEWFQEKPAQSPYRQRQIKTYPKML